VQEASVDLAVGVTLFIAGIAAAFALGRMLPRSKAAPNDSGHRTATEDLAFEREMRLALAQILDRLTRIEMSFNGHPNWDQVRELIEKEISEHEFHEHGKDRRKPKGG